MAKYQIDFNWGGSSHSYNYFEADSDPEKVAAEVATKCVDEKHAGARIFSAVKWPSTLTVREYDNEKKQVKRGGHKFKLRLKYLKMTFRGGGFKKEEWYESELETV